MNRREEDDFVMEKLDRAFAIIEWVNSYPKYVLQNLPIVRSDHGLILLDYESSTPFRRRPFRFEKMWLSHPSCKSVVQKAWHNRVTGSSAFQLWHKLINVRDEFQVWNKEVFGKVENEIHMIQNQLKLVQNSISSLADVKREPELREELEILMQREEVIWVQKARSDWVLFGDRNTRFFQTVVKQRRVKNRIMHLKRGDGSFTDDLGEIEDILAQHFKSAWTMLLYLITRSLLKLELYPYLNYLLINSLL